MNIILINPPDPEKGKWVREGRCQQIDIWGVPFPPLTLAQIAGQLDVNDAVEVIDAASERLGLEELFNRLTAFSPELAVLSTATPTLAKDLGWFSPLMKQRFPSCLIAATGIHVSVLPEEVLSAFPSLDYAIIGEPEITVADLVNAMRKHPPEERKTEFWLEIPGLAGRVDGRIRKSPPRPAIDPLDNLAKSRWDGIDFANYPMPIRNCRFGLVSFARGCPHDCSFCAASAYYGKKIRRYSPEKVVAEIVRLHTEYNVEEYLFWTEHVTADPEYLRAVIAGLNKRDMLGRIGWVGNSRSDVPDLSIFRDMRAAGCWQLAFGLEFGSDRMLRLVGKGGRHTLETARKTISAAADTGIACVGHFIMGYPGERREDLTATMDFACSLPLSLAHFYAPTPFPGSRLFEEAKANDWFEWPSYNDGGTDGGVTLAQDKPSLSGTGLIPPDEVERYIGMAYRRFYFRPSIMLRVARMARNTSELVQISKLGLRFATSSFMRAAK